jgi:hypothetical protein
MREPSLTRPIHQTNKCHQIHRTKDRIKHAPRSRKPEIYKNQEDKSMVEDTVEPDGPCVFDVSEAHVERWVIRKGFCANGSLKCLGTERR